MNRKYIPCLVLLFFLASCSTPHEKLISLKQYDESLDMLVDKLNNNPKHRKHIGSLEIVYTMANKADNDSILELKKSGRPDIWPEVYRLYHMLDHRQTLVSGLPVNVLEGIKYSHVDYYLDIKVARENSALYYYAHAKQLMQVDGLINGRKAFEELLEITNYYEEYKDVDALMRHALLLGTDRVVIKIVNRSAKPMFPFFTGTVLDIDLDLNEEKYLQFDQKPVQGRNYRYYIIIAIDNILLSPDRTNKDYIEYSDNLTGEEGEPLLCRVTKITQKKSAMITGSVEYFDNQTNVAVYKTPVKAKTSYRNVSYYATGDLMVCPQEVRDKIHTKIKAFPSNDSMIRDVAIKFRDAVHSVIWNPEYLSSN